jgi:ABC-type multidrug transport system permease subunit
MTTATRNVGAARVGIALIVLVLYGVAVAVLVNVQIPAANKDVLMLLLGNLGPLLGAIGGYYFNITAPRRGTTNGTG